MLTAGRPAGGAVQGECSGSLSPTLGAQTLTFTYWGAGPCCRGPQGTPLGPREVRVGSCGPGTSGECLGTLVVPQQHLLSFSKSHQGSRGQHPRLAHTPAQGFPEAPGFFDEVLGSPNQGPHWCTQALGGKEESLACLSLDVVCPWCWGSGCEGTGQGRHGGPLWRGVKGAPDQRLPAQELGTQLCLLLRAPPPSRAWGAAQQLPTLEKQSDTESQCSTM